MVRFMWTSGVSSLGAAVRSDVLFCGSAGRADCGAGLFFKADLRGFVGVRSADAAVLGGGIAVTLRSGVVSGVYSRVADGLDLSSETGACVTREITSFACDARSEGTWVCSD